MADQDCRPPSGGSGGEELDETTAPRASVGGFPHKIGAYTIKRPIGSGGMGVVYEAVQENPRRAVAVKVMKQGVTSPSALRRFEYEAQILGRLTHPCIAQIYEAGTHEEPSGAVPFFAMEYIPSAKPITVYAEEKKLGLRKVLELFAQVCDGVHHGHQKGIVHRDLKPGNILMDPEGRPKIIDFGVARATDSDMAMPTLQTNVGQLVGTLQYMSPEQCEADPHNVDIRSDVYSLGLVLYHLLCGKLPYDVSGVPLTEAARRIQEQPLDAPALADSSLPPDVRTIVRKAMEKDRERRYQSAFGLAQDIRRYLGGEAIVARPPSIGYQLTLLARRHKPLIASAAAILVVLVVGVVVSTSLFLQARAASAHAEAQRRKAMAALNYLQEMVWSADPSKFGNEVKVGDLLDRYGASIDTAFPDDPEIQAMMHTTVGVTYVGLELFESQSKAEHYKQAARTHLQAGLRLREETLGEDHPDTLASMEHLARMFRFHGQPSEAERYLRRALQIREAKRGADHPETLRTRGLLAKQLQRDGRVEEATGIARATVESMARVLGEEHPDTLAASSDLARLLWESGAHEESEELRAQALETALRVFGEGERITETARGDLAYAYVAAGRFDEAAQLYHNKRAPAELAVESWHQGGADPEHDPTVLVFWDSWCPSSQVEIPKLQEQYEKLRRDGLQLIGLTARSDKEHVREFLDAKDVTFPMAQDSADRDSWSYFNVMETPTATAIKDGRVVWQGRAEQLNDAVFQSLLSDGS